MIILIAVTGLILTGFIYLLCVPVHFEIEYNIEKTSLESGVIRLYPFTYRIRPGKQSEQKKQKTKKRMKIWIRHIQLMRDESGTLRQVVRNAVRFIHRIVISSECHLNAYLTGGFNEPHITGCFYGGVCAIQPMFDKSLEIFYTPDFTKDSLYGKVTGCLVVRLYGVIREILIFVWRVPVLRLLKIYFKLRKGGSDGE